MGPSQSSVLAYFVGMIVSFIGQKVYTFEISKTHYRQLLRFSVLSVIGLSVAHWNLYVVTEILSVAPMWGIAITSILIPILNFVIMKTWVFESDR